MLSIQKYYFCEMLQKQLGFIAKTAISEWLSDMAE